MNSNNPISEQYRLASLKWVKANAAADLLEETKSAVLSQKMAALGDMPVSHAERAVKSSPAWQEHIEKIVDARREANELKVEADYLRMKFYEWQSHEATARVEARL
jgi:uncharacterized coiled-coil DUF342 family protein